MLYVFWYPDGRPTFLDPCHLSPLLNLQCLQSVRVGISGCGLMPCHERSVWFVYNYERGPLCSDCHSWWWRWCRSRDNNIKFRVEFGHLLDSSDSLGIIAFPVFPAFEFKFIGLFPFSLNQLFNDIYCTICISYYCAKGGSIRQLTGWNLRI